MSIDPRLLEMLVCPACREQLQMRPDSEEIGCSGCKRIYPVRDGIAVMLVDQARETKSDPPVDSA